MAGSRRGFKKNNILRRVQGSTKKPIKYINDVKLNFTLMNCQSLKNKLSSLSENFKMNNSTFIVANETWFKKKDPQ